MTPAVDKNRCELPHIQAIQLLNQLNYQKIECACSLHYKYYSLNHISIENAVLNETLTIQGLLSDIRTHLTTVKYLDTKKGKFENFNRTWQKWLFFF